MQKELALFKVPSMGKRRFKSIASSGNSAVFPCGPCRQFLAEFNENMTVYAENDKKITK